MSRRLYLGKLSTDTRTDDLEDLFRNFSKLTECRVMNGFGFVEFESSKDAEDAVAEFNGKPFMGSNIIVEFAKDTRRRELPRRDYDRGAYPPPTRNRRPPGFRLSVEGVSREVSWQDLKDFGREAGPVSFADLDHDNPGYGILEYLGREEAEKAAKSLDGKDLRGRPVRVTLDDGSGPDNYRRDNRDRVDRYRDDRRDDRYRDDRRDNGRDRGDDRDYRRDDRDRRRERSRSPPPRRRSISPRRDVKRADDEENYRRRDDRRREDDDRHAEERRY